MRPVRLAFIALLALVAGHATAADAAPEPTTQKYSGDSRRYIQAANGPDGTVHRIWFDAKEVGAGDLYYSAESTQTLGSGTAPEPIRVNSQPGSVTVAGTVRGPRLSVGPDGSVHVAWMGSKSAEPRGPDKGAPMLYARLAPDATAFTRQQNVARGAGHLDGGGSVAAGPDGLVVVTWHGGAAKETARAVYAAVSRDGGATFADERQLGPAGVCPCCGMESAIDAAGRLLILYRAVSPDGGRNATLLTAAPPYTQASQETLGVWKIKGCPMSTGAILITPDGPAIAWERQARIEARLPGIDGVVAVPFADGRFKHPAVARAADGSWVIAAAANTSWNRGGDLVYLTLSPSGERRAGGREPGLPAHSRPAVVIGVAGIPVVAY